MKQLRKLLAVEIVLYDTVCLCKMDTVLEVAM
jgi:hypothetical protein